MITDLASLELKRAKRSNDPWADEELVLVADGRTVATTSNLANEEILDAIVRAFNRCRAADRAGRWTDRDLPEP